MQITGKNLLLVWQGLHDAKGECRNQIATCPDFDLYSDDIEELEAQLGLYEKLIARVKRALTKEGYTFKED